MEIFFLFLLGLLVGSFLNVVIFRMEREESFVGGRSRCLACGTELHWYDNIPLVSFLMLRGQCRFCKKRLSWQYPLVELVTGFLFASTVLIGQWYSGWLYLAVMAVLISSICFAVLITVYDLRFSLIPEVFLWGMNVSAFCYLLLHWVTGTELPGVFLPNVGSSLLGAVLAGGFFFILVFFSKETWMGWGDVWLGLWGGMLLGLPLVQVFITLSFSLGAVVGLSLIFLRKKTLKTQIPFAPYILVSGFLLLGALYEAPYVLQFLSPWLPGTIK